ncbi:nadh oxidase of the flavin-dependent disulfide reductase family [hydrocarbon metagenome]|uniref:Nadh oxidase of the flavin-dependent disulfide reductase family n=1 Tax=hydrocarbon metagenome TaxID=938273 RepID=A0A0W8E3K9_9ZZZZ
MRVVIVGNGAAGNQAAASIRKYSSECEIIMFAREPFPEYSACALPDVLAGWIPLDKTYLKTWADYEEQQIKTCFGREVESIDINNQTLEAGGETYHYDRLIMASGSRPIIPAIDGTHLKGNFVVKTPHDIELIIQHKPGRAVVVGAGNIGIETAAALRHRGCEVSIIEMQDRIMPLLYDQKPAGRIQTLLEQENIQVFIGERVTEVVGGQQVERLLTDQQTIECDTVIWAAGVRQNNELARKAGLKIGDLGGIEVDKHMRCSHPVVLACGDCVESSHVFTGKPSLSLLWSSAKRQADVAAANCMGQTCEYEGSCSLVIEEIMGIPCIAIGLNLQGLAGYEVEVIEHESQDIYCRLLIVNDRIAGYQCIGSLDGASSIFTMIKKGTTLSEARKVLLNKNSLSDMAWYLDCSRYVEY